MLIKTSKSIMTDKKSARIMTLGSSFIVQFIDVIDQTRSATAFCDDLATAQKTLAMIMEREFEESRIPVSFA